MALKKYLVASAMCLAFPAQAQDAPADVIIGDWRISQELPGVCQVITRVSDRIVLVAIITKSDRQVAIFLHSDIWRLADQQTLSGEISWDNWLTSHTATFRTDPLHESLRTSADDIVLATGLTDLPKDEPTFPRRFWVKIPEIYFSGSFTIGDGPTVASAIEACLAS